MTVLYFQKPTDVWLELLRQVAAQFPAVDFHYGTEAESRLIARAEVIICSKPSRSLIEQAQALRLLLVPISGITHLPLDLLHRRGVRVGNTHGNAAVVAERAMAMILAFYGRIIEFHHDLRHERWHGFWSGQGLDDTWESIFHKRVSILGAGAIGCSLARLLVPFGCRVTGFKRTPPDRTPEGFERVVTDLDEAIDGAEIVVIALPATAQTERLIDGARIEAMGRALLVNVGRGSIVDEQALFDACRNGTLRGAAIDTWYTYPEHGTVGPPSRFPIHQLDNVVLSPHIAGYTRHSALRCTEETVENLRRYLKDGTLLHEADPATAY
ncbi:MAG: hydroxyacid dehydrogenase [Spirochaetaceae bacterium]|nr:MAG: hydroxyacid dehydrogenase [Spirochaetaceae bacterium]